MNIVTHRFRGFSDRENSYRGFKTALEEGVVAFEFDVRLTSDGIPVVNHDRSINLLNGDRFDILTNNYRDLINSTGGDEHLRVIMSLAEALEIFAGLREDESKIFIDIKDYGEEEVIVSMINEHSLRGSVVIVSWLPEVLFRIHVLDPGLPLCFSHNYIHSTLQFNLMKEFLTNKTVKHVVGSMTGAIKPAYAAGLKNIDFFFDNGFCFQSRKPDGKSRVFLLSPDAGHDDFPAISKRSCPGGPNFRYFENVVTISAFHNRADFAGA